MAGKLREWTIVLALSLVAVEIAFQAAVRQVKIIAGVRPVLVVSVPLTRDYERAAREDKPPPLSAALRSLATKLGIAYVDILELTKDADWKTYFLACDGHWSDEGHRMASELLARHHPLRR